MPTMPIRKRAAGSQAEDGVQPLGMLLCTMVKCHAPLGIINVVTLQIYRNFEI